MVKSFLKKIEKIQQQRKELDAAENDALRELEEFLEKEESPPTEEELTEALRALFYAKDPRKNFFITQKIDITDYVNKFEDDYEQRSYCYIKR